MGSSKGPRVCMLEVEAKMKSWVEVTEVRGSLHSSSHIDSFLIVITFELRYNGGKAIPDLELCALKWFIFLIKKSKDEREVFGLWVVFCAGFWLVTNLPARVFPFIDNVWVAYNERKLGWLSTGVITLLCVLWGVSYIVS